MKRALSILSLVAALVLPASILTAASVGPLLQSFVDKHELAGAVALVVDNKKVLSVEAVGFADIAGKTLDLEHIPGHHLILNRFNPTLLKQNESGRPDSN